MWQAVVGTSAIMDTLDIMLNDHQNRISFMSRMTIMAWHLDIMLNNRHSFMPRMIIMAWQGIGDEYDESVQLHNKYYNILVDFCIQIVHSGHLQMSDNTAHIQFSSRISSTRYWP